MPKKSCVDKLKLAYCYASGAYSRTELANMFNTSPNNITNIIRREKMEGTYSPIPEGPLCVISDKPKVPSQIAIYDSFSIAKMNNSAETITMSRQLWDAIVVILSKVTYKNKALEDFKDLCFKLMDEVVYNG